MAALGRLAICLALLFAAYATGVSILGAIRRRRHLVRSGTHAAYAVFAQPATNRLLAQSQPPCGFRHGQ